MSGATSIEWTDATWNPTRGCSRISPGCEHCYAETMAGRFCGSGQPFNGYATLSSVGARWTRKVSLIPDMVDLPLHWKKPRRIFVNSMSDLFHEDLDWLHIGRVFDVMERCPQHTFQVLTKRADRMREFMQTEYATTPPPRNVWLGVSVEDQQRADERIHMLLEAPAAVRFLSCEPLLGPVDLTRLYGHVSIGDSVDLCVDALRGLYSAAWTGRNSTPTSPLSKARANAGSVDWVIVGGESGPGARVMRLDWAQRIVNDCKAAGVAAFCKQLGSRPVEFLEPLRLKDRKGGDPTEWPVALRVRQFPPEAAP